MTHVSNRPFEAIKQELVTCAESGWAGKQVRVHSDAKGSVTRAHQCCMFVQYREDKGKFYLIVVSGIVNTFNADTMEHLDLGPIPDITGANIGTLAADVVTGKFKALLEKSRDEVCPRNYRI